MSKESKEFVKDLRNLADLYEKHPDLKVPYVGNLSVFVTKKGLAESAKELAYLKPEKEYVEDWFNLSVTFKTFNLQFSIEREKVCKRVLVGKKTVELPAEPAKPARTEEIPQYEWECTEPILTPTS